MTRGTGFAALLLASLAAYAEAEDKPTEERASEGLRIMHRLVTGALEKEAQCMRAIGDEKFCRCMGSKLPSMDFVQYVGLVVKTDDEVEKLSPEEKGKIEVARKCRDLCLK
jgi:hypothetical protein